MRAQALLSVLLAASVSQAAPTVAVNGHLPSPSDSASIANLGAIAVRMDFNWYDFQPTSGPYSFGYLDPIVAAARSNGLQIYATIAYTPQWASSVPSCTPHVSDDNQKCDNKLPANTADWTNAVTAVVTRYRGQIECWGIWNEPNLKTFFDGSEDDFVNKIFLPAAAAIRAADPTGRICGPELAGLTSSSNWNGKKGTCVAGSCIRNGWELDLKNLLNRVGQHLDVITHHTYKDDAAGVMTAVLDGEYSFGVLTHDAIRRVVDANGGANKEFWLTETGWEHSPFGGYSESDVATRIVDLYSKQEEVCAGTYAASPNDPWKSWTRTYYYHFPYDPGSGWGILNDSGGPKAAYTALKGWTTGRTTTACTGPGSATDAGTPYDAGSPDAGGVDAGSPDAGTPDSGAPDAGSVDAGWTDGGPYEPGVDGGGNPPLDGGSSGGSDAGVDSPPVAGGCGCTGSGATGALALAALLALARRRRARPFTPS